MKPAKAQKKERVSVAYLDPHFQKNLIKYKKHNLKLVIKYVFVNLREKFLTKVGLKKYLF